MEAPRVCGRAWSSVGSAQHPGELPTLRAKTATPRRLRFVPGSCDPVCRDRICIPRDSPSAHRAQRTSHPSGPLPHDPAPPGVSQRRPPRPARPAPSLRGCAPPAESALRSAPAAAPRPPLLAPCAPPRAPRPRWSCCCRCCWGRRPRAVRGAQGAGRCRARESGVRPQRTWGQAGGRALGESRAGGAASGLCAPAGCVHGRLGVAGRVLWAGWSRRQRGPRRGAGCGG